MVDVWLPYGKTHVCVRVPARNLLGTIEPKEQPGAPNATAEVERALQNPIGTKRLSEIAKPEHKVAIVVDDATRHAPSNIIILPVLAELNAAGVKDENVTVIFGCGTHRAVKPEEAERLLGAEVLKRVKTLSHDCKAQDLVYVGTTKTHGSRVLVNKAFAEADVKVLLGDVGFHYYAGYGGGRKSVMPAISCEETIKHNHAMLLQPNARTGVRQRAATGDRTGKGAASTATSRTSGKIEQTSPEAEDCHNPATGTSSAEWGLRTLRQACSQEYSRKRNVRSKFG